MVWLKKSLSSGLSELRMLSISGLGMTGARMNGVLSKRFGEDSLLLTKSWKVSTEAVNVNLELAESMSDPKWWTSLFPTGFISVEFCR